MITLSENLASPLRVKEYETIIRSATLKKRCLLLLNYYNYCQKPGTFPLGNCTFWLSVHMGLSQPLSNLRETWRRQAFAEIQGKWDAPWETEEALIELMKGR